MNDKLDRVRDALRFISPDDWDTCLEMGAAIKHEFGDAGFPIWDEWLRSGGWYGGRATWEKPSGYIEPNDRELIGPPEGWRPSDGDWWGGADGR
jgi:Primase C terminal 2 (PriCT-2)